MNTEYQKLEQWFNQYVHRFDSDDPEIQQNFYLKKLHTQKVCQNIQQLSIELELNDEDHFIASCSALFHDIGRFEQFQKYKTFADKLSIDHAELGLKIIQQEQVLASLSEDVQNKIITAIKYHNKLEVPENLNKDEEFFARLLRDADKLDIFRVVNEYYDQLLEHDDQNHAIVLGLPNNDEFSDEVIEEILQGGMVRSQNMRTVNDFKLLQIAWVFDINFVPALRLISEKQFIQNIYRHLPKHPKVQEAYEQIINYLNTNCEKEINTPLF